MKRKKLGALTLALGALLLVLSTGGCIKGDSSRNDTKQRLVLDMDGKPLTGGEKYVAERSFKDGRNIAYRRNAREIAALVEVLKSDGFTDQELLDPKTWAGLNICEQTSAAGCIGGCSLTRQCRGLAAPPERLSNPALSLLRYCRCVQ